MSLERDVRGIKFSISVSSEGKFGTRFQDRWIEADSLDKLVSKLQTATREAFSDVEIKFNRFYWERMRRSRYGYSDDDQEGKLLPRVRTGTVVGFNVHQRGLIVIWDDSPVIKGKRERDVDHRWHHSQSVDLILEDAVEEAELNQLGRKYDEAKKALEKFLEGKQVDLQKLWDEAVAEVPS